MSEIGHIDISIWFLHHRVNMQNWYAFIFKLKKFHSDTTQNLTIPFCSHFRSRNALWRMQTGRAKSLRFLRAKSMQTSRRALDPFAISEELENYTNKTLNKLELQLLV